jgi:hypothetical protein
VGRENHHRFGEGQARALVFWIVVACIIAARVAFLDPSRIQPATANSAVPSMLAGGASSVAHGAKL